MIAALLPPQVAAAEEFGDPPGGFLFTEEADLVAGSVPLRRAEFTTVRMCARRAMARLGVEPVPLLPGLHGAPRWPSDVVGGMTHCAGYRAAAVSLRRYVTAIGIDAEPDRHLKPGVLRTIAGPAEQDHVRHLRLSHPRTAWDRLLFSAKESVYKACFPATGNRLGFFDAAISFDASAGTFRARMRTPGVVIAGRHHHMLDGTWHAGGGLLLTSVVIADGDRPAGDFGAIDLGKAALDQTGGQALRGQ
ncbi:4'-phosphopantetheinyl transferase family protein [Streptomyces sp. NPDC054838]